MNRTKRASLILRGRSALAGALRMLIVFALAFSTTLGAQAAYASSQQGGAAEVTAQADKGAGGKDDSKKSDSDEDDKSDDGKDDSKKDDGNKDDSKKDDGKKDEGDGEDDGKKDDPAPEPSSSSSSSEPTPAPTVAIENFSVYVVEEDVNGNSVVDTTKPESIETYASARAFAQNGKVASDDRLVIDVHGGHLKFGIVAEWSDGSLECDPGYFTFQISDASKELASVATPNDKIGTLTANGGKNGTVEVTAVMKDATHALDGAPTQTKFAVALTNQESTPYVTGIEIWDGEKDITRGSYTFPEGETMKTATIALQAKVATHDPVTGEDKTYTVSVGNGLSKQTGGAIADITWEVIYDDRGSVSQDGEYRAIVEGDNTVRAVSHAGLNGADLVAETMIVLEGSGHAQGSLSIDVVWETQPDAVVKSKTLSVADVRKIGTKTQSYTVYGSFGNSSFVTYTGRGVLLADLLKNVGIDDSGVAALRLDCYDAKGYEISWGLLVGKNRYYFPNMDIGSQSDALQVAPMLAIESARAPEGSSDPVAEDKLTDDDCFRLLFGVGMDDQGQNTRQMQRRWVNAIHVTLAGGPEAKPASNNDPQGPAKDPEKNPEKNPKKDSKRPVGQENPGEGSGNGETSEAGGSGAEAAPAMEGAGGDSTDGGEDARPNQGAWSILQAVNRNSSDVDALEFDNPFRPYTAPVCVGLFAAGGAEAFARFRWQKRKPDSSEVKDA